MWSEASGSIVLTPDQLLPSGPKSPRVPAACSHRQDSGLALSGVPLTPNPVSQSLLHPLPVWACACSLGKPIDRCAVCVFFHWYHCQFVSGTWAFPWTLEAGGWETGGVPGNGASCSPEEASVAEPAQPARLLCSDGCEALTNSVAQTAGGQWHSLSDDLPWVLGTGPRLLSLRILSYLGSLSHLEEEFPCRNARFV